MNLQTRAVETVVKQCFQPWGEKGRDRSGAGGRLSAKRGRRQVVSRAGQVAGHQQSGTGGKSSAERGKRQAVTGAGQASRQCPYCAPGPVLSSGGSRLPGPDLVLLEPRLCWEVGEGCLMSPSVQAMPLRVQTPWTGLWLSVILTGFC